MHYALRAPDSPARDPSLGRSRLFGDTRTLRLHLAPSLPPGTDPSPCPCNTQPPPRPTPKHTRILRSRDRPRVGDLSNLARSNLESRLQVLVLAHSHSRSRSRASAPRPTASESALISVTLAHSYVQRCMCWRGTLVKLLLFPSPASARITSVNAYMLLRAQLGVRIAQLRMSRLSPNCCRNK